MQLTYQEQASWGRQALGRLPYVPLLLAAIVMVIPYYWMVIGAFKNFSELQAAPPTFIVHNPTFDNFYNPNWSRDKPQAQELQGLFQNYPQTTGGFMRFYFNSLVVAIANTVLELLVASIAACCRNIIFPAGMRSSS